MYFITLSSWLYVHFTTPECCTHGGSIDVTPLHYPFAIYLSHIIRYNMDLNIVVVII